MVLKGGDYKGVNQLSPETLRMPEVGSKLVLVTHKNPVGTGYHLWNTATYY